MRPSQIIIPTRNVHFGNEPDQYFPVRGLNFNDLLSLMQENAPDMFKLWDEFADVRKGLEGADFTSTAAMDLITRSAKQFPDLLTAAIALAADDPDGKEQIGKLPLSVQIAALENIFVASIRTEAEVKRVGELLLLVMKTMMIAWMKTKQAASQAGFGASAKA